MKYPVDQLIQFEKEFLDNTITPSSLTKNDILFFDWLGNPLFSINQISSRSGVNRNKIAYTIESLGIEAVNSHYNAWLYDKNDTKELITFLIMEFRVKNLKNRG